MDADLAKWAEQVCEALSECGDMPLANLARAIPNATTNEVAMAVGWLARDGRVGFKQGKGIWEIYLRKPPDTPRHEMHIARVD